MAEQIKLSDYFTDMMGKPKWAAEKDNFISDTYDFILNQIYRIIKNSKFKKLYDTILQNLRLLKLEII